MVVQPKWVVPMKLNGNAQADPAAGPSLAVQVDLRMLKIRQRLGGSFNTQSQIRWLSQSQIRWLSQILIQYQSLRKNNLQRFFQLCDRP